MQKFTALGIACTIFLCSIIPVGAQSGDVPEAFSKFETKITARYDEEMQEKILKRVQERLLDMSYDTTLSSSTQQKISQTQKFLHEALFTRWYEAEFAQTAQKSKESEVRESLKNELNNQTLSRFTDLLSSEREFLAINTQGEFVKDNSIYKISYSNYFPVNTQTIRAIESKVCLMIEPTPGDVRCIENYELFLKKPYSELSDDFAGLFTSDYRVLEKQGNYYGYLFDKYRFYDDAYGAYYTQLATSGFDPKKTFLYLDINGRYNFVTDFKERKLVSKSFLFGISQKQDFLKYMLADSKHLSSDVSQNMLAAQKTANSIKKGSTQEETFANIYAWILENISYTQIIDLQNTQMFSASEVLKTGNGVCTAYARLMSYFLLYHNFYDVEAIEGYVIDASDFPQIGHAWVRVGDRYYDPTFDDPIGIKKTRSVEDYRYFSLPRDIFYANRFHYEDLPESFKTASKAQISQYIFNIFSNLLGTYGAEAQNYHVFAPVLFRNTYNISANTFLTPELIASKIGSYQVAKNSFTYTKDSKSVLISGLKYYTLTPENTQGVLENLNYNIADMTLFDWELPDGSREWRLAYELTTR